MYLFGLTYCECNYVSFSKRSMEVCNLEISKFIDSLYIMSIQEMVTSPWQLSDCMSV